MSVIEPERSMPAPPQTPYFRSFSRAMYGNARWQLTQSQYAAGVLLAQVAVEMGVRLAFISLFVRRPGRMDADARLRTVPDMSFMNERTRRTWTDLTGGDRVDEPEDVWTPYHEHVRLRNRIAHGDEWGDSRGGKDAWDSWQAAGTFIARLDAAMAALDGS